MSRSRGPRQLEIQGHRGARGLWPENTLVGFAATLAIGVDTIELDVGLSSDGVVVVHHDPTLNPATTRDAQGQWVDAAARTPIRALTLEQLQGYDVGRLQPGTEYAQKWPAQRAVDGERIPTLRAVIELLERCAATSVRLNIEVKLNPEQPQLTASPQDFAQALIRLLEDTGMNSRATVQSFDWRLMARIQQYAPHLPTGYLSEQRDGHDTVSARNGVASPWTNGMNLDEWHGSLPRMVHAAGGKVWAPNFQNLNVDAVGEAHELGLRIAVWTVNEHEDIRSMIAMGVDSIISDYPDRVRELAQSAALVVAKPPPRAD